MGQTLGPLSEGEAAHAPTARDDDDTLSEREDTQTQGYTPFGTLAVGKVGESSAGGVAKKGMLVDGVGATCEGGGKEFLVTNKLSLRQDPAGKCQSRS